MKFHPLADIFPLMNPTEYEALKADIAEHGLREAIWTWEDQIVDGRNRYNVCVELGIEPRFRQWPGGGDLLAFIISMNLHRRHLNESQRGRVANRLARLPAHRPNKWANLPTFTQPEAARLFNVSTRTVKQARKVDEGIDELNKIVDDGKVAVSLAAKMVGEEKGDQIDFVNKVEKGIKPSIAAKIVKQEAAQRKRENETDADVNPFILHGKFQEIGQQIASESVDMIFTDPPYNAHAVQLYADLSIFARRVLKPGGVCLTYSGHSHLPEVIRVMGLHLEYMWTASIKHTGGELRFRKYHIRNAFKPILIYYKPPLSVWWDWFSDMASGGKEKSGHKWQQAEAEARHYIKALCPKGGFVLDPMCGSGTTLVAAKELGMKYVGIDEDIQAVKEARGRTK